MMKEDVIRLNEQLKGKKAEEVLDYFLEKYQGHIALASSLGIEDQVLTAMICGIRLPVFLLWTPGGCFLKHIV